MINNTLNKNKIFRGNLNTFPKLMVGEGVKCLKTGEW